MEAWNGVQRQIASSESDAAQRAYNEEAASLGWTTPAGAPTANPHDPVQQQEHAATAEKIDGYMQAEAKAQAKPADPLKSSGVANVVGGGIAGAVQDTLNTGIALTKAIPKLLGATNLMQNVTPYSFANDIFPHSSNPGEELARGLVKFTTETAAMNQGAGLLGLTGATAHSLSGAAANMVLSADTHENVSNLVQRYTEFGGPIVRALAVKPGDTAGEVAIKSGLEGLALGGIGSKVVDGFGAAINWMRGTQNVKDVMAKVAEEAGAPRPPPPVEPGVEAQPATIITADMPKPGAPVEPPPKANTQDLGPTPVEVEAARKSSLSNYTGEETPAEMDAKIAADVSINEKAILNAKGKPLTLDEAAVELAKRQGVTPEQVLARRQGEPLDLGIMLKTIALYDQEAAKLKVLMEDSINKQTPAAFAAAADQWERMRLFGYADSGVSADASRLLNARKMMGNKGLSDLMEEEQRQYVMSMGGEDKMTESFKRVLKAMEVDPAAATGALIRKTRVKAFHDAAYEVYVNTLLHNPSTYVKNFLGNGLMMGKSVVERAIAPYVGKTLEINAKVAQDTWKLYDELKSKVPSDFTSVSELRKHQQLLDKTTALLKSMKESGVQKGEAAQFLKGSATTLTSDIISAFKGLGDGLDFWAIEPRSSEMKAAIPAGVKGAGRTAVKAQQTRQALSQEAQSMGKFADHPYETGHLPAISSDNFGYIKPEDGAELTSMQKAWNKGVDVFGNLQRLPGTLLGNADNFAKIANYKGEVRAVAFRMGVQQGLTGDALDGFMTKIVADPPEFIHLAAKDRAAVNTFTNPLEWKSYQLIQDLIDQDVKGIQPLKWIVPFSKTGMNISKEGVESTPLAFLADSHNEAMAKGGEAAQLAKAKIAFGSTMLTLTTIAAMEGVIKGSGPADPKVKRERESMGEKFDGFQMGKVWAPFDAAGPFAPIARLAGDFNDIGHAYGEAVPQARIDQIAGLSALAIAKMYSPDTVAMSFTKFMDSVRTGKIGDYTSSIVAKTIPLIEYSDLARRAIDPNQRVTGPEQDEPFSWITQVMNKIKDEIPGLSSTLPSRQNMWGQDILYPPGLSHGTISPIYASDFTGKDKVVNEIVRLGYAGPLWKADAPPGQTFLELGMPPKDLVSGNGSVTLSPSQYYNFVQLSAGIGIDPKLWASSNGKPIPPLKDKLLEIISSDYAKDLGGRNSPIYNDQNKRAVLSKYVNAYRQVAKAQMEMHYPDVGKALSAGRMDYMNARIKNQLPPDLGQSDEQFGALPPEFRRLQ